MTLNFYIWKNDEKTLHGTLTPDETDSPLLEALPSVNAPDGRKLHPEDGEEFLRAMHEAMRNGSMFWTEILE